MTLIKWTGTAAVIIATICRALDYHTADLVIGLIGTILWAIAAIKQKDYPLITVNVFVLMILIYGIIK